ncbi:MAG TPA: aminotransferase class I/II-fold pyridoxal phosphate-dependent enzyme [Bryobacteraceae bacterium]|jgi:glycine C-acetyltransferase
MTIPPVIPLDTNCERSSTTTSGELFDGFFTSGRTWGYDKNAILDVRGRRLFGMMSLACQEDCYPYQVPLESRTGPWVQAEGRRMLMLSSYDYLSLVGDQRIEAAAIAAIRRFGSASGGARLLTGTNVLHLQIEKDLAAFKGTDAALTFSSGYNANLGVISGLFTPQDRVILDSLSHRSLVDACRLAGVQLQRYRHNDLDSLRGELRSGTGNRTLIVADGVFSMDGDICPLPELIQIKRDFGCLLMIDDAHAIGVLGETGHGTDEHYGCRTSDVDLWTGSLAKSIPSTGGFIAMSEEVAVFLQHSASPYIFSAALCPASSGAIREGLAILNAEPQLVARLRDRANYLRAGLQDLGYDTGSSKTPIIPVIMKDEEAALRLSRALRDHSILVSPVVFPAVALGTARLRICVNAGHTIADLDHTLDAFRKLRK